MSCPTHDSNGFATSAMSLDRDQRASPDVFDVEGTLARYAGDAGLLIEMIGFFLEDGPKLTDDLYAAVAAEDAPALRKVAHALKGLVAACGGKRAAQAAQRIENAGELGDLTDIEPLLESLETELELLRRAVATHHS